MGADGRIFFKAGLTEDEVRAATSLIWELDASGVVGYYKGGQVVARWDTTRPVPLLWCRLAGWRGAQASDLALVLSSHDPSIQQRLGGGGVDGSGQGDAGGL